MFNSILETTTTGTTVTISNLLIAIITSFFLGIVISFVYMKTQKDKNPSQSFALTLVILPPVISFIIMLIGTNIASALSLGGAFSIIRFRSAPADSKDISFVLFSMAVGLGCGLGYVAYAAIVSIVLCIIMVVLYLTNFGVSKVTSKILKITIPENLDYQNTFDGVLKKYTKNYILTKVKTLDLGSLYQLVYSITMNDDINEKDLIDELRCRNGNLNITLVLDKDEEMI